MPDNNHFHRSSGISCMFFSLLPKLRYLPQYRAVNSRGSELVVFAFQVVFGICIWTLGFEFSRCVELSIEPVCESVMRVDGV
jgi:hypothetical protein